MACALDAGVAICATTAPECDWVCGPLAREKFGVAPPVDDPEVVNGELTCARGAGAAICATTAPECEGVQLIW